MKIEIPKSTRFLPLQEYAPDEPTLAGVGLHVWVDPPRSILQEFDELNLKFSQVLNKISAKLGGAPARKATPAERLGNWLQVLTQRSQDTHFKSATESYRRSLNAWYARLWSQSSDVETHWSVDELEKINEDNPHLYEWLCNSSWALIEKHRDDVKKGWRGPSERSPAPDAPATPS